MVDILVGHYLWCGSNSAYLLNHQKDAEYIELLNDNFEKMAAQMKDKEDALREKEEEIDKVKRTLVKADRERQLDWVKNRKS